MIITCSKCRQIFNFFFSNEHERVKETGTHHFSCLQGKTDGPPSVNQEKPWALAFLAK